MVMAAMLVVDVRNSVVISVVMMVGMVVRVMEMLVVVVIMVVTGVIMVRMVIMRMIMLRVARPAQNPQKRPALAPHQPYPQRDNAEITQFLDQRGGIVHALRGNVEHPERQRHQPDGHRPLQQGCQQ